MRDLLEKLDEVNTDTSDFDYVIMKGASDLLGSPVFKDAIPYNNLELTALCSVLIGTLNELFKHMDIKWKDTPTEENKGEQYA
jgi:hypothetical protein